MSREFGFKIESVEYYRIYLLVSTELHIVKADVVFKINIIVLAGGANLTDRLPVTMLIIEDIIFNLFIFYKELQRDQAVRHPGKNSGVSDGSGGQKYGLRT